MGQAAWFQNYHPEKIQSAIERYQKETMRIVGVIDGWLAKTGQKWLVAEEEGKGSEGKCTYADLSFVPWGANVNWLMGKDVFEGGKYNHYNEWMERLKARPAVAAMLKEKAEAMANEQKH